ncbi:MAG TPA: ABC transporter permease [Gemmatimonadaceae bacterium]|nr:ABC transporter permease [Gemmatimonadaceae bacterium]
MSFIRRLFDTGRTESLSRDIEREVAFHMNERVEELRAQGHSEEDARMLARRLFGNPTFQREQTRDADVVRWFDSLLGDVRYGLRALRRSPAFTAVAILSLALGIGANTGIYTLVDAIVLRPLPVPHAERLAQVTGSDEGFGVWTNPIWEAIRDRQNAFEHVAAFSGTMFRLGAGGEERRTAGSLVSGDYFQLFDVQPVLGRMLTTNDDVRGCPATAVLSYGFWQREYGGRDVVGQTIALDAKPFQIVGIARPGFTGPEVGRDVGVWVPLCADAVFRPESSGLDERSNWWLEIIGRRAETMSLAQAGARLKTMAPAVFAATVPPNWSVKGKEEYLTRALFARDAASGVSDIRQRYTKALLVMMGAVGLVLLIACANVANLLLVRAASREREVAIRLAVGAGRARLVRQLLTESIMLAALGATLGLFVTQWGTRALVALISNQDTQLSVHTAFDLRVLVFTAAITTITALIFGLVPAWRGTRISPQAAMKAGGRGVAEGGHRRFTLSKSLVVAQVALSLTLLVGAALLIGSLRNLSTVNPGFTPRGVIITSVAFPSTKGGERQRMTALRSDLLDRVRHLPGVRAASASDLTPISCCSWNDEIYVNGYTPKSDMDAIAWMNRVSDGYFTTMATKLLAGRDFDASDVLGGPTAAIVNQSFAKKFFGTTSPLGKQFRTKQGDTFSDPYNIIGVVEDAKYRSLREDDSQTAYLAASQELARGNITLEVRGEGDPLLLVPALKTAVAEMSRAATVSFVPLETQVAQSLQRERVLAVLSGLFGAVALALAMLGLYGVMSYTVARRRNEIGVRIALGADRSRVLGMVLGDVARVVAVGLVIGAAGAIASGKLVTSFLFGLTPTEPWVMALATGVLAVVALASGLAPALRATRVDPVSALRED